MTSNGPRVNGLCSAVRDIAAPIMLTKDHVRLGNAPPAAASLLLHILARACTGVKHTTHCFKTIRAKALTCTSYTEPAASIASPLTPSHFLASLGRSDGNAPITT